VQSIRAALDGGVDHAPRGIAEIARHNCWSAP
jgi:hypothetical protein